MKYKTHTALSTAFLLAACAHAEWHYGIGSGIGASSYDGDLKFANAKLDVEYDQDDFEGGFGAAGFATDGTWVFQLSGSSVEYESKDTIKGASERSKNNFQRSYGEFTVGYVAYREDAITLTPYIGINYTKHEWDLKASSDRYKFDDTWVDAVFGLKLDYKINDEWTWNNSAEYTAGDSEGCYGVKTGVSWKFAEHWVTGAYVGIEHDEFDGSDGGDFDYDADVTTFGLTLMYTW
jgi:outer membrane scaffolding protein for murein synthesis (MipA/OmpV family)